jgi:signal transduction histidine kinase
VYCLPSTLRRRILCVLATISLICLSGFVSHAATVEGLGVKRVLILHSFGRNFAPFTAVSSTFRSELAQQSAAPIEFLEASLESTLFAEAASETPLVEYLRAMFAKRPADLLVAIGAPAMMFFQRHRETLSGVPMLVVAADKRRLGDLERDGNATAFGISLDLAGVVENILRLLPKTTNIEVVTGNSPFERFWQTEFRRDTQHLNDRVRLNWLNDLSFEEIRRRSSILPRDSAIVYFLLVVDAAGLPYEQERALDVLRRESNAPIFGIFDHQLGHGIVGGPLSPYQEVSRQSARIALRILNGTPASSIQPVFLGPAAPEYDWRELRRWGINESRLPPGSLVRFRSPSVWQQYHWYIIAALAIMALQAVLITDLLLERARRRRGETDLQRNREQLAHVTRISTMGELAASLAHELNQPLTAILSNAQAAQRFLNAKPAELKEVDEILEDIVTDNNRAGEVIRRMRALVKKEELDFAPINIVSVINDVVQLVHSDGILRNIRVQIECQDGLPRVRGDRVQLQQVVLNLLINAFDAMKEAIATERNVKVRAKTNGAGTVEVSVRDHGTGLTSNELARIFQPFYTTKREGLGMGLPISRSIIEAHGGRLWAENNADRGATFHFTVLAIDGAPSHGTDMDR